MTFKEIIKNEEIKTYIDKANENLGAIGFTEHGLPHVMNTAKIAGQILEDLNYDEHTCELARIAGYMHDIGNMVNRVSHALSGATLAFEILHRLDFPDEDIAEIVSAIGHHDESTAAAVSPIAAALILADKSDVRRSRVRSKETIDLDIHDRVNYAVENSELRMVIDDEEKSAICLYIKIDTRICPVMNYFTIFLDRMVLCQKAAEYLGLKFELMINNSRLL